MLFKRKQAQQIVEHIAQTPNDQSYWANVRRQFRKNRLAVWSLRIFAVIFAIAVFADFLANDKPLACRLDGKTMFPVFKQYAVSLGLAQWDEKFVQNPWSEHKYEWAVFPLIPYSPTSQDRYNRNFVSPFAKQAKIDSWRKHHMMGTDQLGRDVAAGMIHGTRIAVSVGVIAMSISTVIGIILGSIAGYFGDDRLKMSRIRVIHNLLGLFFAFFYAFIARRYALSYASQETGFLKAFGISLAIFIGIMLLANALASALKYLPILGKKINIPADIIIMRVIEILNSIPTLLLILSIVAITKPSIINVMIIIGLVGWTSIARFIRAELLKVRNLEYIEAAQALGYSEKRIIWRHAIPNALTPVLIAIAFGIASAILTEAFLSFLGIGVAAEEVTWGSLLNLARSKFSAWWLAVFPGFAIFITVTIFNLIGEGLTDALDPRLKQ